MVAVPGQSATVRHEVYRLRTQQAVGGRAEGEMSSVHEGNVLKFPIILRKHICNNFASEFFLHTGAGGSGGEV